MKNKIIPSLFAVALGLILFFAAVNNFGSGAADYIVLGLFELLGCSLYLACGVLFLLRLDEKVLILGRIGQALTLVCYPFIFIIEIIIVMARFGAPALAPTAWIMDLMIMVVFVCGFALTVVCIFVKLDLLRRIRDLCLGCVLAIMLLMLVFDQVGNQTILANLPVANLVLLILYGGIVFFALQDTLLFAKDRLTAEKKEKVTLEEKEEEPVQEEEVNLEGTEEPKPEEE